MDYPSNPQQNSSQTEPTCPRHSDRVSYARCKRCMRPACGECQINLDVGMICPDCYRELYGRQYQARTPRRFVPYVTYTLIGINVVVYLLQLIIPQYWVYSMFALKWDYTEFTGEYYRVLTSGFLHSQNDYSHIVMNMLSLYIFGIALEQMMGWWRYLLVYLFSIVGGSFGVLLLDDPTAEVVGASGGIFGLIGAYLVIMVVLRERDNIRALMIMIAVNVAFGFLVPGISWQAHAGGFVIGALATVVLLAPQIIQRTRSIRR